MIVGLRTAGQAARVAALTGGEHLPGTAGRDGTPRLSRLVDVGLDFEMHRPAVEAVSVLFDLYDGDGDGYAATGSPGEPVPTGWVVTAAKFEVEWPTDPDRARLVRSHFGARRKAFNWGLAQVKTDLAARRADPQHVSVGWDLASLRWAWNRAKDEVAPWWAENSKEAYSSGLADLARALDNWHASKTGTRAGRRVGFPRFTSARRDPGRVRFSTGAMRLDADRRTITVPVIGKLRSMENTRRVQRHVVGGRARILNMTLSQRWGRLFISVGYALRTPTTPRTAARPTTRAGVDLGMRTLATVATIDTATGEETLTEYPNPAPLRATLTARRRAGRELSRRIPGSRGWNTAKSQADLPRPPVCAPTAGSSPPAHHRARGCLRPPRDRRSRPGRDETGYGAAGIPPRGIRCGDGGNTPSAGLQGGPLRRSADGGRSLVCLQSNPPRLPPNRRHPMSIVRQAPHGQAPGVPAHR
jgi:putative transposase